MTRRERLGRMRVFTKLGSRLTYANVMSTIAVFIALGGGAYAAVTLPKNSVGPKQIKPNAVSSSKVQDRSLLARDFAAGQLPAGARGAQGSQGPPGPTGSNGSNGSNGANGTNGSALVARPHAAAPFQTVTAAGPPAPPNVAMVGNTWTQQPGEVDYITGQANVTAPANCATSGDTAFEGALYLDGTSQVYPSPGPNINMADSFEASSTYDVRDVFPALGRHNPINILALSNVLVLPGPGVATPHTLTAGVIDLCSAAHHYTVNSLEVEVASAH